jgi:hypothetical protein
LTDKVPQLVSLQLEFEDRSGIVGGSKYLRRVLVDRAAALFLVPCGDARCTSDEHDITSGIMPFLLQGKTSFHGDDACGGSIGDTPCMRTLRFEAVATYTTAN